MNIRYRVQLTLEEREALRLLCEGGNQKVRRIKRAQILLATDSGLSDDSIAKTLPVSTSTVYRTKQRFVQDGLESALSEEPRLGAQRKLSDKEEVLLMAVACTKPPKGWAHWTLELLADPMVALTSHEGISRQTVRRRLHDKSIKPWQHKMWCIAKVDAEYIARMEDVLDL